MAKTAKLPPGMWKRGDVYYARFRSAGRLVRERLSTDKRVAEEMLAEMKLRGYRREQGVIDDDVALDKIAKQWLAEKWQHTRASTATRYELGVINILAGIPVRKVKLLTREHVVTYQADRKAAGVSPGTINFETTALKAILAWAVDHEHIGSNPLAKLKPLPHTPKEGRALERAEVQAVLAASLDAYREIFYCLFHTGMRVGELKTLKFRDVDFAAREIVVRVREGNKSKRERRIPVNEKLLAILKRRHDEAPFRVPGSRSGVATTELIGKRLTKEHVFVTQQNTPLGNNLYREFLAACRRAGVPVQTRDAEGVLVDHVDLHSTRRTFITQMIESGVDPRTVQEIVGHKDCRMTMEVYARVRGETKRRAMADLSYDAEPIILSMTG